MDTPVARSSLVRSPRVGLALGSGSARGWSHIGVIRVLERAGVSPDIVCGTSMCALVGAAYAAGDLLDVLTTSLNIMQVSITRSRLASDPADVLIRPSLSDFALIDFHRAAEAIAEGQRAAEQALPEISELLGAAVPRQPGLAR